MRYTVIRMMYVAITKRISAPPSLLKSTSYAPVQKHKLIHSRTQKNCLLYSLKIVFLRQKIVLPGLLNGKSERLPRVGSEDKPSSIKKMLDPNCAALVWNVSYCSLLLLLMACLSSYHEKATKRCTSSLRSCQPSIYHTKMGEFR